MGVVLTALRLALAAFFLVAAAGKVANRRQATALLERFALPGLLGPAVRAVPAVEATAAMALLAGRTARLAAWTCAALLVVFSALLLRNRAAGRRVACGCFGERGASLADARPLWRNAVLFVAALVVALARPERALWSEAVRLGAWRSAALVAGALAVVLVATAPIERLRARRDPATLDLPLHTLRGEATSLSRLLDEGGPTLLVFVAPGCSACRSLLAPLRARAASRAMPPLVVVTPSPAAVDGELRRAVAGASAVVGDDGALARRFGLVATPTAVELDPTGRVLRTSVGAAEVTAVLAGRAGNDGPAGHDGHDDARVHLAEAAPAVLSRRRVVTLAVGALATYVPLGRTARLARSARAGTGTAGGVRCPSCGTCSVCSYDAASRKLTCRPCHQACSGKKLCASYANELGAFRALATWLAGLGFHQEHEPFTLGMEQDGKLTILSSLTPFSGGGGATPRALLVYDLTGTGERAWAALLDARGRFVEVAAVDAGQVVRAPVTHPPAAGASPAHAGHARAVAAPGVEQRPEVAAGYGCADLCGFALGVAVALATLPAAALSAPGWVAAGFAASLFSSGLGLIGASGASGAVGVLTPLALGGSLVDGVIDSLTSLDTGLHQSAFCDALCKLETKYCCNYGCGCDTDYHACLARCPLDLQHPMAACNTYVRLGPGTSWVQVTGTPSKCKV